MRGQTHRDGKYINGRQGLAGCGQQGVSECQGLRGGLRGDKSILELDGSDNYVTL